MNINDMVSRAFNAILNNPAISQSIRDAALQAQGVRVIFNHRLRTCAGKARARLNLITRKPEKFWIEINPSLFNRISDDEQYNTVSHEIAHIIDFFLRGDSNHDYIWQNLHRLCGGNGQQRHNYDVTGLRKKVQRIILRDNVTMRELRVTVQTFNKVRGHFRYTHLRTEIYQGTTLVATHAA